ncbi:TetR/AcrR family transcriptional regulator [Amycolatopsis pigmentata]|uniref:TetR/AcrR family transcriptional regulator n=1 Tax=Amycolatopsis pigmentata TaxID=450801 RepID=A0ABW5FX36_9PSEU
MANARSGTPPMGRRAEYAELTRRAILDAAHDLYVRKGYFATKVEEIAHAARVAPATVYAVGGGKSGLLQALVESGIAAEDIPPIVRRIESADDPDELLRFIVHITRVKFEEWSGLIRQVFAAAPREPSVRQVLRLANGSLRGGLTLTAHQFQRMGALRKGLDVSKTTEVLYFYLSNAAYFIRTDDLGWSLDESEPWLVEALRFALFDRTSR